jgi:hypothetical protein
MIDFKSLIINLKIIGHLKTGVKLNAREKFFELDDINWYQGLFRLYRRDDRTVTYEKITFLIKDLSELILLEDKKLHDTTGNMFKNRLEFNGYIFPILSEAINGLKTLTTTYKDDETFIAQLELELDRLIRISYLVRPEKLSIGDSSDTETETDE